MLEDADADGYVPIDLRLTARKASEYQAGAGFGTDTGLRGSLSWEQHRLNKHGHRLGGTLQLSEIGASAEGRYTIPFGDPRREEYGIFAGYSEDDPDTSDSRLAQFGIVRSTTLGGPRLDLSFTYQREDFTVAGQTGLTDLFIPGAALSWVKADDRLFTRNGLRWNLSVRGTAGAVSDFAFLQPRASGKWIHGFSDARIILRGEAAFTVAKLENLPASIRFFAGGDQSVRGFDYEALGPENEEGKVTGGRHLLVGSAEVDYGITGKWRVAAFLDAGNAFDDFTEPLRKSVGIGIRRITPIGPIRIDLARPISGGGRSVRLHIGLGPDL
ncbi:MAG: Translocation and assembly module subunit TamA [Gammaproteobacteria bacterium]|nr:Translocation and assembly module subunit TamA [Gammaproteobacteria bacterium]